MAATTYTVTAKSVWSYTSQSNSGKKVKEYKKGAEVKIVNLVNGFGEIKGKGTWINTAYLKKAESRTSDAGSSGYKGTAKENTDAPVEADITGNSESDYNELMLRYVRAFGSPPKYTSEVDPYYTTNSNGIYVGRAMASTWFTNPSILSIAPGTVDYLPGFFNKGDKNKLFNKIKGSMSGALLDSAVNDKESDLNGPLYAFKSAYNDYMNVVNLLCRVSADFLGIGNVTDLNYGTNIALNKFDYGFYTNPSSVVGKQSIFSQTMASVNSALDNSSYVHFFVNHQGVDVSDNISTEAGETWIEKQIGSESDMRTAAQTLQFLFGGAIGSTASADIDSLISSVSDNNALLGGITKITSNYLKGGQLVFPKMITNMSYDKSISVELQFTSVYGDIRSIFKYVIVPVLHLLAFATPKQLSGNMYTYPFLVRAYQPGNVNADLAYISNLSLTRGGSDNTSWTDNTLPTEINAKFNITPLYSNLMVTSAKNPFLFLQNTALMEYLGVMCGIDLKMNNLETKARVAKNLLTNRVTDIPTNLARGIMDTKLVNEARKFFQIIG